MTARRRRKPTRGSFRPGTENLMNRCPWLRPRGERHGNSVLLERDVRAIREAYRAGASMRELGALYGVSHRQIGNVVRRRHWRHVTDQAEAA